MALSLYSNVPQTNFLNNLFVMANVHHSDPEAITDVEDISQKITKHIEENSSNEDFPGIILSTFNAHEKEFKKFAEWVGHHSKSYPGTELEIKGLYEPIHKLFGLVSQKDSVVMDSVLKQIDSDCVKHVEKIPFSNDILEFIIKKHFENCSLNELKEFERTSKKIYSLYQKYIGNGFNTLKIADICDAEKLMDFAKKNPHLTCIDISKILLTSDVLKTLATHLPNLNKLIVKECSTKRQEIQILLENFPNLIELDLSSEHDVPRKNILQDQENLNFTNNLNLKYLNLRKTNCSDLSFLSPLSNLKKLNLSHNSIFLTQQTFKTLKSLEHLDLSFQNIYKERLYCSNLKELKALKSLNLSGNPLDSLDLNALQSLPNLEFLDLSQCKFRPHHPNLLLPVSLKYLILQNSGFELKCINNLKSLVNLTHLEIGDNKKTLSHENLKTLSSLNLKSLKISLDTIHDECVEIFKTFKNLEELTITYWSSDKKTLKNLKSLPKLKLNLKHMAF